MKEREQLIKDEGLRLFPYRCRAGKITIGIGRNLEGNPLTPNEIMHLLLSRPHIQVNNMEAKSLSKMLLVDFYQNGITKDEALFLFENDLNTVASQLRSRLKWYSSAPEEVQNILFNMTFQMGIASVLSFKNTLAAIERKDYKAAAEGMKNSLWAKQTPVRANRLIKRMEKV
jgi:lysozyme